MKTAKELKRLSDRSLSKYSLDLRDEIAAMQAALAIAKREQRARRNVKTSRRKCGRKDYSYAMPMHSGIVH